MYIIKFLKLSQLKNSKLWGMMTAVPYIGIYIGAIFATCAKLGKCFEVERSCCSNL